MKKYYVLWIPVKEPGPLRFIAKPGRKKIEDDKKFGGYIIQGNIDIGSFDFTLYYESIKRGCHTKNKNSIIFKCEEYNNFGFILYSIDFGSYLETDSFVNSLKDQLNPSIYHYIKGFFHKHECHHTSADSLIRAYISSEKISLVKDLSVILDYYISQYFDKFSKFVKSYTPEFDKAKLCVNNLLDIRRGFKTFRRLIDYGNTIKGEKVYCDFLITYKEEQGTFYKENEYKFCWSKINEFIDEVCTSYSISSSGLSLKLTIWGVVFGVIGFFIGLIALVKPPSVDYKLINQHTDSVVATSTNVIDTRIKCIQKMIVDSSYFLNEKTTNLQKIININDSVNH